MAPPSHSRLRKTYIILLSTAAVCIIVGALVPEHPTISQVLHLILIHIGIGLVVACLVASIFDRLYHDELIGKPLREIQTKIEAAQEGLENFRKELSELEQTVVKHNTVLRMSKEEGIIAMYRRNSQEFKDAAAKAVSEAKEFVYTVGRSHRTMLIEDGDYPGWLMDTLLNRISLVEGLTIKVLLANTFDKDSGYRKQLSLLPTEGRARYLASRDTAFGLLRFVDEKVRSPNVSIKLMKDTPPYALLMTEDRAFVEHYLPSQRGGAYLVYEIEKPKPGARREKESAVNLHDVFRLDFLALYNQGEPLALVLRNYLERKKEEFGGDLSQHLKEIVEKYMPAADKWSSTFEGEREQRGQG